MLKGRCPNCGFHRVGWGLSNPRYQVCPKCGVGLEITDGDRIVSTGYSPFNAERYSINLPTKTLPPGDKQKNRHEKRK